VQQASMSIFPENEQNVSFFSYKITVGH